MPTVLSFEGYDVQIFTHDHLPAHVHVFARGCEAILNLNCPDGVVRVREQFRFKSAELKKIVQAVQQDRSLLCHTWEEIHGQLGRRI